MDDLARRVRQRAQERDLDLSPREVAEVVWLQDQWRRAGVSFGDEEEAQQEPDDTSPDEPLRPPRRDPPPRPRPADRPAPAPRAQAEVALADQEATHTGATADRITTAVEPQLPFPRRLAFARGMHRLSTVRPSPVARQIDIRSTVDATAAAAGQLRLVFRPVTERATHLWVIRDTATSLVPWRDASSTATDIAREVGSFASVDAIDVDLSAPGPITFTRNGRPIGPRSLGAPGHTNLLFLITDGLGEAIIDGRLGHVLSTLPADSKLAWLHPWGAHRWKRTPAGRLRLGRLGAATPDAPLVVPIVPLDADGLAALESWARGRGAGNLLGRRLPAVVQVSDEDRPDAPSDHEIDWMDRARRLGAQVEPQTLELLALASAVPGKGVDLELLFSLGRRFLPGPDTIRRVHLAEAITSGFFRCLPTPDERRTVLGFRSKAARESLRGFLDHDRIGDVLQFLVDGYLEDRGRGLREDLQIPVDLLVRAAGLEEEAGGGQEWDEEVIASLVSVTRSTRSERWRLEEGWLGSGEGLERLDAEEGREAPADDGAEELTVDTDTQHAFSDVSGPVTDADRYFGREQELAEALAVLDRSRTVRHVVVDTPRLYGATSFLRRLSALHQTRLPEDLVVYVNCGEAGTGPGGSLVDGIVRAVAEAAAIPGPPPIQDGDPPPDPPEMFLVQACPRGGHIVLFLDEFGAHAGRSLTRQDLKELWRTLSAAAIERRLSAATTDTPPVVLVLTCDPALDDLDSWEFIGPPDLGHVRIPLLPLDRSATTALIESGLRRAGIGPPDGVGHEVHRLCGGHPQLVQWTGQALAQRLGEGGTPPDRDDTAWLDLLVSKARILFATLVGLYAPDLDTVRSSWEAARAGGRTPGNAELLAKTDDILDREALLERLQNAGLAHDAGGRLEPAGTLLIRYLRQQYGLFRRSEATSLVDQLPTFVAVPWNELKTEDIPAQQLGMALIGVVEALLVLVAQILLWGVFDVQGRNILLPETHRRRLSDWAKTPSIGKLEALLRSLVDGRDGRGPLEHPFLALAKRALEELFQSSHRTPGTPPSFTEFRNNLFHGVPGASSEQLAHIESFTATTESLLRHLVEILADQEIRLVGRAHGHDWDLRGVEPTRTPVPDASTDHGDGLWLYSFDGAPRPMWPMMTFAMNAPSDDERSDPKLLTLRKFSDRTLEYSPPRRRGRVYSGENALDAERRAFERFVALRPPEELVSPVVVECAVEEIAGPVRGFLSPGTEPVGLAWRAAAAEDEQPPVEYPDGTFEYRVAEPPRKAWREIDHSQIQRLGTGVLRVSVLGEGPERRTSHPVHDNEAWLHLSRSVSTEGEPFLSLDELRLSDGTSVLLEAPLTPLHDWIRRRIALASGEPEEIDAKRSDTRQAKGVYRDDASLAFLLPTPIARAWKTVLDIDEGPEQGAQVLVSAATQLFQVLTQILLSAIHERCDTRFPDEYKSRLMDWCCRPRLGPLVDLCRALVHGETDVDSRVQPWRTLAVNALASLVDEVATNGRAKASIVEISKHLLNPDRPLDASVVVQSTHHQASKTEALLMELVDVMGATGATLLGVAGGQAWELMGEDPVPTQLPPLLSDLGDGLWLIYQGSERLPLWPMMIFRQRDQKPDLLQMEAMSVENQGLYLSALGDQERREKMSRAEHHAFERLTTVGDEADQAPLVLVRGLSESLNHHAMELLFPEGARLDGPNDEDGWEMSVTGEPPLSVVEVLDGVDLPAWRTMDRDQLFRCASAVVRVRPAGSGSPADETGDRAQNEVILDLDLDSSGRPVISAFNTLTHGPIPNASAEHVLAWIRVMGTASRVADSLAEDSEGSSAGVHDLERDFQEKKARVLQLKGQIQKENWLAAELEKKNEQDRSEVSRKKDELEKLASRVQVLEKGVERMKRVRKEYLRSIDALNSEMDGSQKTRDDD